MRRVQPHQPPIQPKMRGSKTRSLRRSHKPKDVGSNPTPASNYYDHIKDSRSKSLSCPQCGSQRPWKDGLRHPRSNEGPPIQRWSCRNCGFRFSETLKPLQKTFYGSLNTSSAILLDRRVRVSEGGTKNLVTVETREEGPPREGTKPDPATIKGLIVQFAFWLQKEGYADSISYPRILERLVKRGVNLLDPESVKEVIAKHKCKDGTKILEVYAYDALTKMLNIEWSKPHYRQEEILPFIPEERELDQLITACRSQRMATYLQTLKETFADPGEALKLRWTDVTGNVISIRPIKGHSPRQLNISNKLIAMLNNLPKTSERIFPTTYGAMHSAYCRMKRRIAHMTQNPRLKAISFNSFRHWGGTMLFHHTRNLLLVQKILGHKRITSTMKYVQLINFQEEEYDVSAATTVEEDQELLKAGFEYITERNGIKLYRRPKIFSKLASVHG